jgi:hypothetical protein
VLITPAQGGDCGGRQKSARFLLNYWRVLFQLMLSLWAWISMGNSTVSRSRVQAFFFCNTSLRFASAFRPEKKGEVERFAGQLFKELESLLRTTD